MTLRERKPNTGPESLEGVEPGSRDSLASEAPLKLVALGTGIHEAKGNVQRHKGEARRPLRSRTRLECLVGTCAAGNESSIPHQFSLGSNNSVRLLIDAADIPAQPWDSLPRPARSPKKKAPPPSEWKKWFQSPVPGPAPGAWPPKAASSGFCEDVRQRD